MSHVLLRVTQSPTEEIPRAASTPRFCHFLSNVTLPLHDAASLPPVTCILSSTPYGACPHRLEVSLMHLARGNEAIRKRPVEFPGISLPWPH